MKQRLDELPLETRIAVESLMRMFSFVHNELDALSRAVLKEASLDEDVKRLMTIPGIGPITALAFKHEIDLSQGQLEYIWGLTPRRYASGETQKQGKISKRGPKETRSLLVEAGIVLLTRSKKWNKLKTWELKIMRKHGTKKAAVAVGRKLAVIMHKMLIEKTDFIYGERKEKKQPK